MTFSYNTHHTIHLKKYAHGFVVLCFVVVMQSFIMNSHEVFIHILQDCFAGTGAIVRLPQCQWSKPDGNGKISQCITTTKHSKAKTVCIFLGIYCTSVSKPVEGWFTALHWFVVCSIMDEVLILWSITWKNHVPLWWEFDLGICKILAIIFRISKRCQMFRSQCVNKSVIH